MPETQITLTGKRHKEYTALKKKIEADVMLNLSNPQILDYLMSFYRIRTEQE